MELDIGYRHFDTAECKLVHSFKSLVDYDPASSSLEDAVGSHYYIYRAKTGELLLYYIIRGQRAFMAPAFTAAEGVFPIPGDFATLIAERNRSDVARARSEPPKQFEKVIEELYQWYSYMSANGGGYPWEKDLNHDIREMLICLNAGAFRGCLAMAGVILERTLKAFLVKRNTEFVNDWMVGRLIGAVENSG